MKKMWLNSKNCFCITAMCCMLIAAGCKKLLQVDEPDDSMTSPEIFSNDSLAQSAVNGLYIKLLSSTKFLLNGGMSLFPALSADELVRTTPMNNEDQFILNNISSNNLLVNANLWKAAYVYIYQCNICIDGLHKSTGVSVDLKN